MKFLDEGGYNGNERAGDWQLVMGRQRRAKKENKFTIGTERYENIKTLYTNKIIIIIIIIIIIDRLIGLWVIVSDH